MVFILARKYWARKGGEVSFLSPAPEKKHLPFIRKVYCGDCRWFRVNDMSFEYPSNSGQMFYHSHIVNECDHPKNIEKIPYYKDTFLKREEHFKFKDKQTPERRNRDNLCALWTDKAKDIGDWEV